MRPPRSTLTYRLFPATTPFRSAYLGERPAIPPQGVFGDLHAPRRDVALWRHADEGREAVGEGGARKRDLVRQVPGCPGMIDLAVYQGERPPDKRRSEEHTSELQSLMRISYAVFCLKKKKK